jgi:outer membrane receptor protein involved in Fe transport
MIEVGFKSILMDGTLRFNVAAHWTDYTNLLAQFQTTFIDPDTGVFVVSTSSINGGDIKANGLEFEVQYVPTVEWSLGLNAAFLDAEFGEFGQTPPYQFNRGVPTTFQDMNGETPGWSPDLVVNFFADYTYQLDSGATLTPGILFLYSDDYNTSNLYVLDPNHQQDSYTKTDLRLTWLSASGDYRVAAFANNIGDEAVLSRGNSNSQDPVTNGYLYPRNYGVEFQVRF